MLNIHVQHRLPLPHVVVPRVVVKNDTNTLSWEYHYSGIRLVGLPRAGTVIQCIKEGC